MSFKQSTRKRAACRRSTALAAIVIVFAFAVIHALWAETQATARPEDVIAFVNQTIVWYRQLANQQQLVSQPSDAVFLNDDRQIAEQVVRLSFDFARTQAQLLAGQASGNAAQNQEQANSSQRERLVNLVNKSNDEINHVQSELDSLKQQLATASGKKRKLLESSIAETEDELELLKARRDTIQNFLQFATGLSAGSSGPKSLQFQIEELARTVPGASGESKQASAANSAPVGPVTPVAVATSGDRKDNSSGIFSLIGDVLEFRRKLRLLDDSVALTDSLAQSAATLRAPLVTHIREYTQRSDELAGQPPSDDPIVLARQRSELQGLTGRYKQLSAVILPLGKQNMLLDVYKRNLANWRNVVQSQYSQSLKDLLLRLGILVAVLFLIFAASEIWRRGTFRYVQDVRRRHQFLILRRIIVLPLVAIIIVVAFASGLGSITTFAGLLTAGLAVALQNLILSIVGYFFLIGKYGVRVGDRIQVSGITGDVIDIGLVRLHLVEVTGAAGTKPSGRVVALSNNVVFQPDGIFKQIPGTNFIWHEVSLTLTPESDYRAVEERMLQAVNKVFSGYRDQIESQRRIMERAITGLSVDAMQPECRLHLTQNGTQIIVRYPVEMESAVEIDDRITREILDATGRKPEVSEATTHERRETAAETAGGA
jgi:small-conductance mechanosensitive channel